MYFRVVGLSRKVNLEQFFATATPFDKVVGLAQILGAVSVPVALFLTWQNLKLIRNRMRLETRPILRVDLEVANTGTILRGSDVPAPTGTDSRRDQAMKYRYVQFRLQNLQRKPAGTCLSARVRFLICCQWSGGSSTCTEIERGVPVLEPGEKAGPTGIAEVGAAESFEAKVVSIQFLDVDLNSYSRAHGAVQLAGSLAQQEVRLWGQISEFMTKPVGPRPRFNPFAWGTLAFTLWLTLITIPNIGIPQIVIAWAFFALSSFLWLATFIPPLDRLIGAPIAQQTILPLVLPVSVFLWVTGSVTALPAIGESIRIVVLGGTLAWLVALISMFIWSFKHERHSTWLGSAISVGLVLVGTAYFPRGASPVAGWTLIGFGVFLLTITLLSSKIGRKFPLI